MSKYIYAIHDSDGNFDQGIYDALQGKGHVVITEAIGRDPNDNSGHDYRQWGDITVIARLNNGYGSAGTIPLPQYYDDFAQRCKNFVANSQGCNIWVIGNEPNHSQERPDGQTITAIQYKECYNKCRDAIHSLNQGHTVCVAAVAPWNIESGDWFAYFQAITAGNVDAISLHTYTHGSGPSLITSETKMGAPFDDRHYHFYAYRDLMELAYEKDVPFYITETDQNDPWLDQNNGWVQEAYAEIDRWNQENNQQIRCLALYRWSHDQWAFGDKQGVKAGLSEAIAKDYQWKQGEDIVGLFDGFENGFHYANDPYSGETNVSELEVPNGWTPDWRPSTAPGVNHRPEYKPKIKGQHPEVYAGNYSLGIHTSFSSHDGVIWRQVNVGMGKKVNASAWCMSKGDGGHGMAIAIDPLGRTDFKLLPDSAWQDWWGAYEPGWEEGMWSKISAEETSTSDIVTIYLRTKADYANNNAAHFDNVEITTDGGPVDPPIEPPIEPPTGGIMDYVDALQEDIDAMQANLDALKEFLDTSSIRALPV